MIPEHRKTTLAQDSIRIHTDFLFIDDFHLFPNLRADLFSLRREHKVGSPIRDDRL
jgi:hypothetical protein